MTREEYSELIMYLDSYFFNDEGIPDNTTPVPLTNYELEGIISALEEVRNY